MVNVIQGVGLVMISKLFVKEGDLSMGRYHLTGHFASSLIMGRVYRYTDTALIIINHKCSRRTVHLVSSMNSLLPLVIMSFLGTHTASETGALAISVLTYHRLTYQLKSASNGTTAAHFTEHYIN